MGRVPGAKGETPEGRLGDEGEAELGGVFDAEGIRSLDTSYGNLYSTAFAI